MSEMIERVARALCLANGEDPDKPSGAFGVWWKSYRDEARAALEAMREPSSAQEAVMLDLLERADRPPTKRWHWVWQEMIDAALSEKP